MKKDYAATRDATHEVIYLMTFKSTDRATDDTIDWATIEAIRVAERGVIFWSNDQAIHAATDQATNRTTRNALTELMQ